MKTKKRIIYQDVWFDDFEMWKEEYKLYCKENEIDIEGITDEDIYDFAYMCAEDNLDADMFNLDIETENNIIAIADLGLWNGRTVGYKVLGHNINEIFNNFGCDYIKLYFENNDAKFTGVHHDGTNHLIFREMRFDRDMDRFLDKLYNGEIDIYNKRQLSAWTKPLKDIKKVYGW